MIFLLDANVLIALLVADHVHHDAAESWVASHSGPIATCPITQGSLIRLVMREGQSAATANALLSALTDNERHQFWPDDAPYRDVRMTGVIGHRQVTDAYLAQLARNNRGRLATLDEGLAAHHNDVAELIPANAAVNDVSARKPEPTSWTRRYKQNQERLNSGERNQIAEVVRELSERDRSDGMSASERRMLHRARKLLGDE